MKFNNILGSKDKTKDIITNTFLEQITRIFKNKHHMSIDKLLPLSVLENEFLKKIPKFELKSQPVNSDFKFGLLIRCII